MTPGSHSSKYSMTTVERLTFRGSRPCSLAAEVGACRVTLEQFPCEDMSMLERGNAFFRLWHALDYTVCLTAVPWRPPAVPQSSLPRPAESAASQQSAAGSSAGPPLQPAAQQQGERKHKWAAPEQPEAAHEGAGAAQEEAGSSA